MEYIVQLLQNNRDEKYGTFQGALIPSVSQDNVIGVRTPKLRALAKEIKKSECCETFLSELPHRYFEENQLHAFIISESSDFNETINKLEAFLPYVDNWATCDQMSPKSFKKHKEELLPYIDKWLSSEHTYTVRFAIGMLMKHFLDEDFKEEYIQKVIQVRSQEYYINMEIAWYLATALAKQWDCAIPYIESMKLDKLVHNKTIQKARESFRITDEQKSILKEYKL